MKTNRLNLATAFCISTFFLFCCSSEPGNRNIISLDNFTEVKEILNEGDGWSKWGPTTPIYLSFDSTYLNLKDYLLYGEKLDSVLYYQNSVQSLRIHFNSSKEAFIKTQPSNGVGIISLFVKQGVNKAKRDIPVFASELQAVKIETSGKRMANAEHVYLAGSMNGWSPLTTPLMKDENGVWHVTIHVPFGNHSYQIVTDNTWGLDPANKDSISNEVQEWNSLLQVTPSSAPPSIKVTQADQEGYDLEIQGDYGAELWCFWEDRFVQKIEIGLLRNASLKTPNSATSLKRSHLRIFPVKNGVRGPETLIPLEYGKPIVSTELLDRKDWQSMVMYCLMVDRFNNGMPNNDSPVNDKNIMPIANRQGGDITGIAIKIADGYFDKLGVNTVSLSPISKNAKGAWGAWSDPRTDISSKFSSFQGDWPTSNKLIDPAFGSRAEFNGFVDYAHSADMNVILDYVSNHVHQNHPIYKNHPDWFKGFYQQHDSIITEKYDEHKHTTWFDTFLPSLDLSRKVVYSAMTDSAMWWVKNSAIDGFRHSSTKHVPDVFWRTLTTKMKAMNRKRGRRLFQIGETHGSSSLIRSDISSGKLDAQFDFKHYNACVAAFAFDQGSFENLANVARATLKSYGAHNLMGNITGNKDRIRFTSLADGGVTPENSGHYEGWTQNITHKQGGQGYKKMRMLMSYIMSMPGIPCIYYGDEISDVGGNHPDNKRVMRFDDLSDEEHVNFLWTSEWIKLRRSRMSFIYGSCDIEAISHTLLKITREYLGEQSVVYINKSNEAVQINTSGRNIFAGKAEHLQNGRILIPSQSAICLGD